MPYRRKIVVAVVIVLLALAALLWLSPWSRRPGPQTRPLSSRERVIQDRVEYERAETLKLLERRKAGR